MEEDHLEIFMDLKLHYDGEKTIKFFDPINKPKYQNSLLLNSETRTILDMKIEDPDIFDEIGKIFAKAPVDESKIEQDKIGEEEVKVDEIEDVEKETQKTSKKEIKSFQLKENIDIYTFVNKIITSDYKVVGFIAKGYNKTGADGFVLPGTQMFTYQIR